MAFSQLKTSPSSYTHNISSHMIHGTINIKQISHRNDSVVTAGNQTAVAYINNTGA